MTLNNLLNLCVLLESPDVLAIDIYSNNIFTEQTPGENASHSYKMLGAVSTVEAVAMSAAVLWHENTLKNAETSIQTLILFLTQMVTNTSSTKSLEDHMYVCCQSIKQEV